MLEKNEDDDKKLLSQEDEAEDNFEEEESDGVEAKADDNDDNDDDDSKPVVEEDDLSEYAKNVRTRINRLTARQREAERREAEALEYAKAVKAELDSLKKREATITKSFESEADSRLTAQEQLLRNTLRIAVDTGDVDKQVEVQTELVRLATDRERLRNFKAVRQEADAAPVQQRQAPPQRQARPDPKAQAWATKNNWFGSDRIMTQAAYTIHEDLVGEGYNAAGDDYYRELDNRIRREFPHKFQATKQRTPASTVGTGRPNQAKKAGKEIELTNTQRSIADKLGVSYDAYRRQLKLAMERAD